MKTAHWLLIFTMLIVAVVVAVMFEWIPGRHWVKLLEPDAPTKQTQTAPMAQATEMTLEKAVDSSLENRVGLMLFDAPDDVGDRLPEFTLLTFEGKPVQYNQLKHTKGAVLIFIRSADWCPYCKKQLMAWSARVNDFDTLGYRVIAISRDEPDVNRIAELKLNLHLPLLSDPQSELIRKLDILNREFKQGDSLYGIPHPTIYVVDTAGVIRHRFTEQNYKNRPEIDQVLQVLR